MLYKHRLFTVLILFYVLLYKLRFVSFIINEHDDDDEEEEDDDDNDDDDACV